MFYNACYYKGVIVLRAIKNYFRLRSHKKALLGDLNKVHNITDAYAWIKRFKALDSDTELSRHIKFVIPKQGYIVTNYDNFANLMDATNEACYFYRYGRKLYIQPVDRKTISFTLFFKNKYNTTISDNKVVDYIENYIRYYIDDLLDNSIDETSTSVIRTKELIINIAFLMQAVLVIK